MDDKEKVVIDYYEEYDEDTRMKNNPLEYLRCKEIISRYLESYCMSILDVGGATGAFSFWLSSLGHSVNLIDFTPKHISIAQEHEKSKEIKLASMIVGDARELPFDDEQFDLVLLMGPLYHLAQKMDRIKAIKEAFRVLKPNGRIISEYISRYASMVDGFNFGLIDDPDFISIMNRDIKTGLHIDTSMSKQYFTNSYFHHPNEVSDELQEGGFIFEDLIAVTSIGNMISNLNDKFEDVKFKETLLNTLRLIEKEPSIMGISSHFIGVGRK